ncbi:MAG: AgmX/PglI C-terminal domain-containing protein [Kofleriaceae bacterium]
MADVVEVTARIGHSIIAVAHGASITVGQTGDIYAPTPDVMFTADVIDHSRMVGIVSFDIRRVSAATERVPRAWLEGRPAAYIGLSLLVHVALWGTAHHTTRGYDGVAHPQSARTLPTRVVKVTGMPIVEDELQLGVVSMSLADARNGYGRIADIAGHAAIDVLEDRGSRHTRAISSARTAGILGADALRGEHPLGDIPGAGSPASGFDGRAIEGTARGEATRSAFASERRLRGGCTGDDCGPISAGRYATLCQGEPYAAPCRDGTGGYGLDRSREARIPTVSVCGHRGTPVRCFHTVGDLDRSIIRRYVRRKLGSFQACYERAILSDASFAGTVDVSFVIDATGHTRDVTTTGVRPDVASCVATVVESIQFPSPKGGGLVAVRYPLEFRITGS